MNMYSKFTVLLVVFLSVAACSTRGQKQRKAGSNDTPFTISTADLPALKYELFRTNKKVVNQDIRNLAYSQASEDVVSAMSSAVMEFGPQEKVSYHLLPHAVDLAYLIIRNEIAAGETKYYYGEESDSLISLWEISPVVHLANGKKENRVFRLSLLETGEYYTDIAVIESHPGKFSRQSLSLSHVLQDFPRDFYRDEADPEFSYSDYCKHGKLPTVFSTKDVGKTDFVNLDELWNHFSLRYYENDTSEVAFHILPPYYKNHDLVVERTKTATGTDRYLLRRINLRWDGQEQLRRTASAYKLYEPLLDLTSERLDTLTGEVITTEVEILERNIILVFEERSRGAYNHKSIYSVSPYTRVTEERSGDDQIGYQFYRSHHTWLSAASNDAWFEDMKEAATAKDYLKWLGKNHDKLYAVDMVLYPNDKGRKHLEVSMKARDHIVGMMRQSGLVSEKYEQYWIDYFNEARDYYEKNQDDDERSDYFDYDIFLHSQESDALTAIRDNRMVVTGVRSIAPDRSIVTINMGYQDMTFELSYHAGKWLVDGARNHLATHFATDEPLAIFMVNDPEQKLRMLQHYGMEEEDKFYYTLIQNAIPNFRNNGIDVDILDPKQYLSVQFADKTTFDARNDFYYYDVMLYKPGKAPAIIRNIDRKGSWQEIGAYFGMDGALLDPSILRIPIDLQ